MTGKCKTKHKGTVCERYTLVGKTVSHKSDVGAYACVYIYIH